MNGALIGGPLFIAFSILVLLHWPTALQIGAACGLSGFFGFVFPGVVNAVVRIISHLSPW